MPRYIDQYMVDAVKKLKFHRWTPTAMGILRLRLRAYYANGYGHTTATSVLRLRLRADHGYNYER